MSIVMAQGTHRFLVSYKYVSFYLWFTHIAASRPSEKRERGRRWHQRITTLQSSSFWQLFRFWPFSSRQVCRAHADHLIRILLVMHGKTTKISSDSLCILWLVSFSHVHSYGTDCMPSSSILLCLSEKVHRIWLRCAMPVQKRWNHKFVLRKQRLVLLLQIKRGVLAMCLCLLQ